MKEYQKRFFIPFTVGGGLRNIDDIKRILRAGADKVSLNSAAVRNKELIKERCLLFWKSMYCFSCGCKKKR